MGTFQFPSLRILFPFLLISAGLVPAWPSAGARLIADEKSEPAAPAEKADPDAELIANLTEACRSAADVFSTELAVQSADNLKARARMETKNLIYALAREPDKEKAAALIKDLRLEDLRDTLSSQETDPAIVEDVLGRLGGEGEEMERSDAARVRNILDDYLTALDRNSQGNIREDFAYNCSTLPEDVREYLENPASPEAPGRIAAALDFMDECQHDSTHLEDIANLLRSRFSQPNLLISVGGRVIFPNKPLEFSEPTVVRETIRDVPTYGNGTATGSVGFSFVANENRAQFQLAFKAIVRTRNRADSPMNVTVYTNNVGTVAINQYLLFDEKGVSIGQYRASAQLGEPRVTNVFRGGVQLYSGVIYNQVLKEVSFSRTEAEQLMKTRTVQQFEQRLGEVTKNNDRVAQVWDLLKKYDYLPSVKTRTTANMLECSALIGSSRQVSAAAPPARQLGPHDLVLRVHQSALNNPLHELLAGHTISAKEVQSWVRENLPEVDLDRVAAKAEEAAKRIAREQGEKSSDDEEFEMESVSTSFCEELPAYVTFADGVFGIHLRVDSFAQKEKEFPGLDIDVEYQPEKRGDNWVLARKGFEAWPPELDRGATVPVRYQVIRRQIKNRLGAALPEEIPLSAIPLYELKMGDTPTPAGTAKAAATPTPAAGNDADAGTEEDAPQPPAGENITHASEIRGELTVGEIDFQDGWLLLGADYNAAE